jgi:hypothetical protein
MALKDRFLVDQPLPGEFQSDADLHRFYHLVGSLCPQLVDKDEARISMAEAGAPASPRKVDTNLVDVLRECLKAHSVPFVWKQQRYGSCVGQATAMCCDILMSVAWLLNDSVFPGRTSVGVEYTLGRVEIGGRPGTWWGSNGVWAAKAVIKYGACLLKEAGLSETALVEDERLGARMTALREGCPEALELAAKQRPVHMAPIVRTVNEAIVAIEGGAPVIDCSNLIPAGYVGRNGASPVRRSGGHATVFGGVRWVKGEPQILYVNSWGTNWGDAGSVWITAGDAQAILDQDDSFAFIGITGLSPVSH